MTLLELVVSMTVGGMALAAGGATFALLTDRRERALHEAAVESRALAARESISEWVAGAQPATAGLAAGMRGLHGVRRVGTAELADDEIGFLTTAATPRSDDASFVRLFVAPATANASSALVAEVTDPRGGDTVRVTVADRVAGLEVRYFTRAFGRAEWRDTWTSTSLLPGVVQLRLRAVAGDTFRGGLQWAITVPLANGR